MISFSPKNITKELLLTLPERSRKVLVHRFGLGQASDKRTLDAIGKEYGITRERVRQIESHGLGSIRESEVYTTHTPSFEELRDVLHEHGGIVAEHVLLDEVPKNDADKNHIAFILNVGHHFGYKRENNDFHARWHIDPVHAESIERALKALDDETDLELLTPEDEFLTRFGKHLKDEGVKPRSPETLVRWLKISKRIGKNPLGEWGKTQSPHVHIRNTRDFAYLTLKRHGSPMHFTEVAETIEKLFGRKTHPATTHNELIKDDRFVLVGRGLYALNEWGYAPGVVREVIKNILEREGPLSRADIIDRVKRERYVKDATVLVNLQSGVFTKLPDGRYALA